VLAGYHFSSTEMTVEMCLSACRENEFSYSGLQWQIECYCGDKPTNGFEWAWMNKCHDTCAGNPTQICGGSNAMSVYTTPKSDPNGLCIFDFPSPRRVLDDYSITGYINMTIEYCEAICQEFYYFAVQNGDECYCGDSADRFLPAPQSHCNKPCNGDQTQFCGSNWRSNVYRNLNKSQLLPTNGSETLFSMHISGSVETNRYYDDGLSSQKSELYKDLKNEIESELTSIFESHYLVQSAKVSVTGIKPKGSISLKRRSRHMIAEFVSLCSVRDKTEIATIKNTLIKLVQNSEALTSSTNSFEIAKPKIIKIENQTSAIQNEKIG